jgi:D-alanine-D-alanine ligase
MLEAGTDWQSVIDRFGTVFVKPAREGSSIGMSRVDTAQGLAEAFALASVHGDDVLAEQWVQGPEYTVGILGDETLPAIRLETDNTFYDYQAKYLSDDTRYHCPAGLDAPDEAALSALAWRAFASLDCAVWGRVDVMRGADGTFYVLEVNTVPGMTSHSLVPMAAAAVGMDMSALVLRIVELSLAQERCR